jgi:hypothetical protein
LLVRWLWVRYLLARLREAVAVAWAAEAAEWEVVGLVVAAVVPSPVAVEAAAMPSSVVAAAVPSPVAVEVAAVPSSAVAAAERSPAAAR